MRRKGRMMPGGNRNGGMGRPNNGRRPQRRYGNNQPRGKTHEGKTKQQAYQQRERFLAMARDALQSVDRVQSEYYFQHVDHYNRILNYFEEQEREQEALREAEAGFEDNWEGDDSGDSGEDNAADGDSDAEGDSESDVLPTDPLPNTPVSYGYGMTPPPAQQKQQELQDDSQEREQPQEGDDERRRYGRQPQRVRRPGGYSAPRSYPQE